mgnify:CR=1 FL=1
MGHHAAGGLHHFDRDLPGVLHEDGDRRLAVLRVDQPPFDDVRIRRAFNMAIDKERLVKDITRAMQVPADGPVPPFFAEAMGYPRPTGDPYDPAKARRLLAEAGYPNGVGLPPVDLIYNTYESHRMIAEFVQRSVKENLGVTVTIGNMEWKSLLKRLRAGDFQVSRYGWVGLPDPHWTEAICAVIVPAPGAQLTAADVIAHAETRLDRYKRPRRVVFMTAVPRNLTGRVLKAELKEAVLALPEEETQ